MTVTQRRNRPAADAPEQQQRTSIEPGIKVTCDFCHTDITNTVRFKCAHDECRDLDICASCFTEGKEGQTHKPWHDYMVEEPLTTPIFDPEWGADEEILLISGLVTYGLGNWLEVAAYIGTRTKEDCERHYCQTFLGCTPDGQPYDREKDKVVQSGAKDAKAEVIGDEADVEGPKGNSDRPEQASAEQKEVEQVQPDQVALSVKDQEMVEAEKRKRELMPPMSRHIEYDPDEWQTRKKARIEAVRKPQALPPPSGPLVSAPTNHEVGGYMPGRLEFEHEVDNEAEVPVKDMEFGLVWAFGGDEQPAAKVSVPVDADDEEEEEDDDDSDDDEEEEGEGGEEEKTKKKGKVKGKDKDKDRDKDKDKGKDKDKDPKPKVKIAEPAKEGDMDVDEDDKEDKSDVKSDVSAAESKAGIETNGSPKTDKKGKEKEKEKGNEGEDEAAEPPAEEVEDEGELEVKLALLDIYFSKLDKREEAKELIFDRGLTEYKKIQAAERRRPKDERELLNRYKVFAKLQTALDFEVLTEGLVYEQVLRRRIAELQEYRRNGVTTGAEAEVFEAAKIARAGYRPVLPRDRPEPVVSGARVNAGQHRYLHGVAATPPPGVKYGHGMGDGMGKVPNGGPGRRPPAPLNLANAQSLDLLSLEEQTLCSQLRVLPKPYLSIKELYIRENERRHGGLKRRDARKMLKIDVNKSGRIFDFLVQHGYLRLTYDPNAPPPPPQPIHVPLVQTKSMPHMSAAMADGTGSVGLPVVQPDCAAPPSLSGAGVGQHGVEGMKVNGTNQSL